MSAIAVSWEVDARLHDDDDVPVFSTGAIPPPPAVAAAVAPVAAAAAAVDLPAGHPLTRRRAEAAEGSRAVGVDWRSRFGQSWITSVRDQNPASSCVDFSTTALVEAMVRIERCMWITRSEGDLHDGAGRKVADGWWPTSALEWVQANGLADPGVYPWNLDDAPYAPTPDRGGRTTRIASWSAVVSADDQKDWLDLVGPLAACFEVFEDFYAYGSGIYRPTPNMASAGWHCVLVIGYDDDASCWLCKNSWSSSFGEDGFFRIAYGVSNFDVNPKWGLRGTNPDPFARRNHHAGNLIETADLEMLSTGRTGLRHWRHDGTGWKRAGSHATNAVACPTFTSTTYDRNLEGVYLTDTGRLRHVWNTSGAGGRWKSSAPFGPERSGVPGLVQNDYGNPGNFDVVVSNGQGALEHWWRNGSTLVWAPTVQFGASVAASGPTLVQNRRRELEVVALLDDGSLQRFHREDGGQWSWFAHEVFGGGEIGGYPVMIESTVHGASDERVQGNFELLAPTRTGRVVHYWKDNRGTGDWHRSVEFGSDIASVCGLAESSNGFALEAVVLRRDGRLQHWSRDETGWAPGPVLGSP